VRWLHRGLIALGTVGLVALVLRSGPAVLARDAAALGVGAALVVAVAVLEHALHALAWGRCFDAAHRPSARALFSAQLAAHAVNLATPTATLGGEVVRGGLAAGVPPSARLAALTADRLALALADTGIGVAGCAVLWLSGVLDGPLRLAVAAGGLALAAGVAGFLGLQRRGNLASLVGAGRLPRRLLGPARADRLERAAREIDGRLAALHAERPGDFLAAVALHALGTSVGALQLALFLAWLGVPFTLGGVLAMFAAATALDLFSFFVPWRVGAQEGARMVAFAVGGLEPARGLLFSLVLRLEQLVFGAVGLLLYARALAAVARPAEGRPAC
jgi:Lysylphosphatidylglycerol synthase TM region